MMNTKYDKYWEACNPYDKFLSEEEKRKHESEVLDKHPEYLEQLENRAAF